MRRLRPFRSWAWLLDDRRRRRLARLPLDDVDLPEQLDLPAFADLPPEEQDWRRRRATAIIARRQRYRSRSIAVGAAILVAAVTVSLAAQNTLRDAQIRERDQRVASVKRESDRRVAAQARHDALARYEFCTFVNTNLVGPLVGGIDALTAPVSTVGVTDPATLDRIETSNVGRAQARAAFAGVHQAQCGRRP